MTNSQRPLLLVFALLVPQRNNVRTAALLVLLAAFTACGDRRDGLPLPDETAREIAGVSHRDHVRAARLLSMRLRAHTEGVSNHAIAAMEAHLTEGYQWVDSIRSSRRAKPQRTALGTAPRVLTAGFAVPRLRLFRLLQPAPPPDQDTWESESRAADGTTVRTKMTVTYFNTDLRLEHQAITGVVNFDTEGRPEDLVRWEERVWVERCPDTRGIARGKYTLTTKSAGSEYVASGTVNVDALGRVTDEAQLSGIEYDAAEENVLNDKKRHGRLKGTAPPPHSIVGGNTALRSEPSTQAEASLLHDPAGESAITQDEMVVSSELAMNHLLTLYVAAEGDWQGGHCLKVEPKGVPTGKVKKGDQFEIIAETHHIADNELGGLGVEATASSGSLTPAKTVSPGRFTFTATSDQGATLEFRSVSRRGIGKKTVQINAEDSGKRELITYSEMTIPLPTGTGRLIGEGKFTLQIDDKDRITGVGVLTNRMIFPSACKGSGFDRVFEFEITGERIDTLLHIQQKLKKGGVIASRIDCKTEGGGASGWAEPESYSAGTGAYTFPDRDGATREQKTPFGSSRIILNFVK